MAENLSLNPTCANNTTDWREATWTRITGESVGDTGRTTCGQYSFAAGAYSVGANAGQMAGSSGTTGGLTVTAVFWVKSSVARTVRPTLLRYNGGTSLGPTFGATSDVSLSADTWTKVRRTGTVPTGGTYTRIGAHIDLPTSGTAGTMRVGAVRFVLGDVPDLEFADGDTAGWDWDGTAGNSTSQEDDGPAPVDLVVRNARAAVYATKPLLSLPTISVPTVRLAVAPSQKWAFVIGPASGGYQWWAAQAKARRINLKTTGQSTASFTLRGNDPVAERIVELSTDLHVLRDRGDGVREVLYRGRVGSVSDELSGSGHAVSVPSVDYRGVLERRTLMSGSQVTWTDQDQAVVAFGLIAQAQRLAGGDYGIAQGTATLGTPVTRTFELGDSIGQRIQELSTSDVGFDWEITPEGPSGLTFQAWAKRGQARGVILEYGGLVRALKRDVDSSAYANHVRVTGQPPDGSSTPPTIYEGVAAGIEDPLLFPQGRWDKVFGTSLTTSAATLARKDWAIDYHQVVRPSYTVHLKRGAWQGPDHIWLGDPVRLVVMSGRLKVDDSLRVQEIDISLGDAGEEDVVLTLGAPPPNYSLRTSAILKRLEELERR